MPSDPKAVRCWLNDIRHHIAMAEGFVADVSYDVFKDAGRMSKASCAIASGCADQGSGEPAKHGKRTPLRWCMALRLCTLRSLDMEENGRMGTSTKRAR